MLTKRMTGILLTIAFILTIPLVAQQFTDEVNWTLLDFVVMGSLLLITGLGIELVLRKVKKPENRFALILVVLAIFVLIWIELAVGIFGTPFAGSRLKQNHNLQPVISTPGEISNIK